VRTLAILVATAWVCGAQFAPPPQAESPEEFDAYLAVLDAQTPAATLAAGEAFLRAWPSSGLRGHVYEREFEAYRRLNQLDKAIAAGEKALAAAPDNLLVLAELAQVLANATADEKRLSRAQQYADKVLTLSKSIRLPKFVTPQEWAQTEARVNSIAHAALGLVANQRGDAAGAIHEFETAIALAPQPDATQYYRLGMLYRATGNNAAAKQKFAEAARSGEPAIQDLAKRALRELEHP